MHAMHRIPFTLALALAGTPALGATGDDAQSGQAPDRSYETPAPGADAPTSYDPRASPAGSTEATGSDATTGSTTSPATKSPAAPKPAGGATDPSGQTGAGYQSQPQPTFTDQG